MAVFDMFKRSTDEAPEAKASATGPVIAYSGSGRVAWSPRDTASLIRTGFAGNPVGFRAVKLIAEAAAALPILAQYCRHVVAARRVAALIEDVTARDGKTLFQSRNRITLH